MPLDGDKEFCALVLCSFLGRVKLAGRAECPDGPSRNSLLRRLLSLNSFADGDLSSWMKSSFGKSFTARSWDICRRQADKWREEGIRAAEAGFSKCPAVIVYRGDLQCGLPRLAVFNSRKPLSISPDAGWIEALRSFLKGIEAERIAFAASAGTLTYELVSAHAIRAGLPLVMAAPFSIPAPGLHNSELYTAAGGVLSCTLAANFCPKAVRLTCRDRILAAISQLHLVLEVRSGGNLAAILEERQKKTPAFQFIFDPGKKNSSNGGNLVLFEKFPGSSRQFAPDPSTIRTAGPHGAPKGPKCARRAKPGPPQAQRVEWGKYLYHYTRACPGPWPGQSHSEYLWALLDKEPMCGHSALDTLIRIFMERRIRGGFEMVRGREPVVCWSSHPPSRLCALRRWNTALVRWTVEPYGIAVSRDFLRGLGAKPAVYGSDKTYRRLPDSEKFRFQTSDGAVAWRTEREWRSSGDLDLGHIESKDWFAFVPGSREIERISDIAGFGIPVIAFNEMAPIRGQSSSSL